MSIGQRYSVMVKLNQRPGDYLLRFASYPLGDMQQVIESQAIVSYGVRMAYLSSLGFTSNSLRRILRTACILSISSMNQPQFGC